MPHIYGVQDISTFVIFDDLAVQNEMSQDPFLSKN